MVIPGGNVSIYEYAGRVPQYNARNERSEEKVFISLLITRGAHPEHNTSVSRINGLLIAIRPETE